MQFNYSGQLLKGRTKTWLLVIIKASILIFCSVYILNKIEENKISINTLISVVDGVNLASGLGLLLIIALMPLNWLIEALKWKFLIRPFTRISAIDSLFAVFSGLAFGFATPRSLGDYFGRVIHLDPMHRHRAIIPTILSRVSQLVPTLIIGSAGLMLLLPKVPEIWTIVLWSAILFAGIVLGVILLSLKRKGLQVFDRLAGRLMNHYSWKDQLQVLGMSFIRYFVFILQFIIALKIMDADLPLPIIVAGISWIFLAKSIIPSFNFLSDLGIREFSAVLFFEAFGLPLEPVLLASLLIWTINILFPSVFGVLIIGKSKFDL